MKRDVKLYLEDILDSIKLIDDYIENLSFEQFSENDMIQDAVLRRLAIIGEAARNIPTKLRTITPEIPWRQIVGMRNVIIHEYFDARNIRIWNTAQRDLPPLKNAIRSLLKEV